MQSPEVHSCHLVLALLGLLLAALILVGSVDSARPLAGPFPAASGAGLHL